MTGAFNSVDMLDDDLKGLGLIIWLIACNEAEKDDGSYEKCNSDHLGRLAR